MPSAIHPTAHLRFVRYPPTDIDTDEPADERHRQIAMSAYYKAEIRGFEPGHEIDDWLEAERELVARWRSASTMLP